MERPAARSVLRPKHEPRAPGCAPVGVRRLQSARASPRCGGRDTGGAREEDSCHARFDVCTLHRRGARPLLPVHALPAVPRGRSPLAAHRSSKARGGRRLLRGSLRQRVQASKPGLRSAARLPEAWSDDGTSSLELPTSPRHDRVDVADVGIHVHGAIGPWYETLNEFSPYAMVHDHPSSF
jgi:hypothetical protein